MKKVKTKLEKAKEKFVDEFSPVDYYDGEVHDNYPLQRFRRQLNRLIKLAKEEGAKELGRIHGMVVD